LVCRYRSIVDGLNGQSKLRACARAIAIRHGVGKGDIAVEVIDWFKDVSGGVSVCVGFLGKGASGFIGDGAIWIVFVCDEPLDFEIIGGISIGEASEQLVDGDGVILVFYGVG